MNEPVPLTIATAVKRCLVLGTIEGKVTRVIQNADTGKTWGFELSVTVQNPINGSTWEQPWTVWQEKIDKTQVGDHLIVTGDVSWKYERYTKDGESFERESLKGSVNNATVKNAFVTKEEPF